MVGLQFYRLWFDSSGGFWKSYESVFYLPNYLFVKVIYLVAPESTSHESVSYLLNYWFVKVICLVVSESTFYKKKLYLPNITLHIWW